MPFEFWYTLIIFILMTIFIIRDIVETEIVMFSAVIFLLAGKVITIKQAFVGFSNVGMLTIGMMFVIAGALYHSGAIAQLNKFIFGKNKTGVTGKLIHLLFPVAAVSAFMNNTPVVAILIPAIRSWAERSHFSASKFLIPVSYAAILGGMCTLIGTSTNLIIYGLMIDFGMEGMGLFEISVIGIPIAVLGLIYIIFIGHRSLPEHKESFTMIEEKTREFVIQLKITESYPHIGKTIEEAGLRHLQGLFLFQIYRDNQIIAPAKPTQKLKQGDRLFFTGLPKTILELQKTPGLELLRDSTFDLKQYDASMVRPYEAVISASSPLIGKNVRNSKFREHYNAVIIAIHRNGTRIKKKIGDIILQSGDTLLLLAEKDFYHQWYASNDFYLISQSEAVPSKPKWQVLVSMASLALLLALMIFKILPLVAAAGLAVVLVLVTRAISPYEARQSIDFRVLVIIASAFGIAEGLRASGVAEFIAQAVVLAGESFGSIGVIAGIFIITSILTNFMTNNATAAMVFPITFAAAQQIHADPRPFILALAIAASASFATPISYQTNLMVYGPGGYTFKDFFKIGFPLQVLVMAAAIILLEIFYF
ncbi:MAG: SLC13 family permease [Calditrichaceae bacterium]|nr:SLC13 family permease [Calditrichaceae bacterium]